MFASILKYIARHFREWIAMHRSVNYSRNVFFPQLKISQIRNIKAYFLCIAKWFLLFLSATD